MGSVRGEMMIPRGTWVPDWSKTENNPREEVRTRSKDGRTSEQGRRGLQADKPPREPTPTSAQRRSLGGIHRQAVEKRNQSRRGHQEETRTSLSRRKRQLVRPLTKEQKTWGKGIPRRTTKLSNKGTEPQLRIA